MRLAVFGHGLIHIEGLMEESNLVLQVVDVTDSAQVKFGSSHLAAPHFPCGHHPEKYIYKRYYIYMIIYVPCSCAQNPHALNLWKHGKCHISPARQRQNHHKSHLQLRPAGNGPGNQGWILYIYFFVDIDLIKIGYVTPPENQQPCVPHDPAEASQVTGSTKEENYQSKGFQFWILTLPWNHRWGLLQQGHNPNQIQIRRAVTRHYKNHSNILFFYSSSPKSKLDKCLAFGLGYR